MRKSTLHLFILGGLINFFSCSSVDEKTITSTQNAIAKDSQVQTMPGIDGRVQYKEYLSQEEFAKYWQADTAKKSFRSKALQYDTLTHKIVSVNGINFVGSGMAQIQYLLGEPDVKFSSADSLTLDYFLAPYCGFSEEGCYRWVLELKVKKGVVTDFYSSFIRTD